ncbi:MAG: hypothetical protein HC848_01580 [Limnobacter sp.]|nr:hypothetical protein [Limnobacter sp.]
MQIESPLLVLASKSVGLCRRWQFREAQQFTSHNTPELLKAYSAFAKAQQSGSPRQPFKGRDLWKSCKPLSPKPS